MLATYIYQKCKNTCVINGMNLRSGCVVPKKKGAICLFKLFYKQFHYCTGNAFFYEKIKSGSDNVHDLMKKKRFRRQITINDADYFKCI